MTFNEIKNGHTYKVLLPPPFNMQKVKAEEMRHAETKRTVFRMENDKLFFHLDEENFESFKFEK